MPEKKARMTWIDRLTIEKLYNSGASYRAIACKTGFAASSIHREVQRGLYDHLDSKTWTTSKRYSADIAQADADWQATAKGVPLKLGTNHAYASTVAARILAGESPDQIVGHLRGANLWTVSTVTLYRYIDRGYITGVTNKNLWNKSRKKKRRYHKVRASRPPAGTSIERRPLVIEGRSTFGHWEIDSVIGKARGKNQSLLVLTERQTRYEIIFKVTSKTAAAVTCALSNIAQRYPKGAFQSITVDNGSEFQDADAIRALANAVYYCHPYTSCERGSNENANRIIRRFLPKGQSMAHVTQRDCDAIARYMNNMHRKILGYKTAAELFQQQIDLLRQQNAQQTTSS